MTFSIREWWGLPHRDILSGLVVAFAMISSATGSTALLMTGLVQQGDGLGEGLALQHLLAAGILTGVLQIAWGYLRLAHRMRFVPQPVMAGFVNALAILIFLAQQPAVWGLLALTLAIITLLPLGQSDPDGHPGGGDGDDRRQHRNWGSIRATIRRIPKSDTAVMLLTVVVTVLTHNLAVGLLSGVALAEVTIDMAEAHILDQSGVTAHDQVIRRLRLGGSEVEVIHLNPESTDLFARIGVAGEAGGRGGSLTAAH